MWWSEYEPLDAVNAKDLSDSTTFLELTGAGNLLVSRRRRGSETTWIFLMMTQL